MSASVAEPLDPPARVLVHWRPVPLTEEENRVVKAHLTKHWGEAACPMCRQPGWLMAGHVTIELVESHVGFPTGRGLACVAVICRTCGHTVFVNSRIALGKAKAL